MTLVLFFTLFITYYSYPVVQALPIDYSYDFEDTILTHEVSAGESGFFTTWGYQNPDECEVSTVEEFEGTHSYQVGAGDDPEASASQFNSTLGSLVYLSNATWYIHFESGDGPQSGSVCAYYGFYDYDNTIIVYIKLISDGKAGSLDLYYVDYTNTQHKFADDLASDTWHKLGFQYNNNESVTYWVLEDNTQYQEATDTPRNIVDRPKWNYTKISTQSAMDLGGQWIDLFNVTIVTDWDDIDSEEEFDMDDYCIIGDYGKPMIATNRDNMRYLESQYNVKLDTTLRRIDYLITPTQYALQNKPAYYGYVINGQWNNFQTVTQYTVVNSQGSEQTCYMLSRSSNLGDIEFNNEIVNLAFCWYNDNGIVQKWSNQIASGDAIHDDRNDARKTHNDHAMFNNEKYDGNIQNGCIPWRIWIDCEFEEPTIDEGDCNTDNVTISKSNIGNYSFAIGEPVGLVVTSSTLITTNYIKVYKEGTVVKTFDPMNKCLVSDTYVPKSTGSYNISLIRSGAIIESFNFTVYTPDYYDRFVYTDPNPSHKGQQTRIYFRYYHPENYNGWVVISTSSDAQKTNLYQQSFYVQRNTSGNLSYYFDLTKTYYLYLFVDKGNSNITAYIHKHICKDEYDTYIRANKDTYKEGDAVYIYYSHNYAEGVTVVIKINGAIKRYLNDYYGTYNFVVLESGNYNVTLEVLKGEEYTIIGWDKYIVYGAVETEEEFPFWIVGIIIIMCAFSIPFFVALKRHQKPQIEANITFGFAGLMISILFGFIPYWVLFGFLFLFGFMIIGRIFLKK